MKKGVDFKWGNDQAKGITMLWLTPSLGVTPYSSSLKPNFLTLITLRIYIPRMITSPPSIVSSI